MTIDPALVFGPYGALALAVIMLGLFYTGKILPRSTVPREDYDAQQVIIASYADKFGMLTEAVKGLSVVTSAAVKNGGSK